MDTQPSVAKGLAVTLLRGGLKYAATAAVAHGLMTDGNTEAFIGAGVAIAAEGWSLWNNYGRTIALASLDLLRSKVVTAAASARVGAVSPQSALARLDAHVAETAPAKASIAVP